MTDGVVVVQSCLFVWAGPSLCGSWVYCFIMQVDNLKKETALHWFKDDVEITPEGPANLASGACKLPISLVILSHKHTD